jgi:ABC-2 type transport system permease protein
MTPSASVMWFAGHEVRLAWREMLGMLTAGRRWRPRSVSLLLIVFVIFLHLPAYAVVGRFADVQTPLDQSTAIVITASIFLAWALVLSQAIESVTRVFYARADLDLIMSSPAPLTNLFSVRIAAIALTVTLMAMLLATPFVNVLVIGGGARWFSAYAVVIAMGLSASACAIAITVGLFQLCGPAKTRLVAQIISAVTGAGFVIALQVAAILSYGTLSRFAVLTSDAAAAFAPEARQRRVVARARDAWRYRSTGAAAGGRVDPAGKRHGDLLAAIQQLRGQCRTIGASSTQESRKTVSTGLST